MVRFLRAGHSDSARRPLRQLDTLENLATYYGIRRSSSEETIRCENVSRSESLVFFIDRSLAKTVVAAPCGPQADRRGP